jgi:serine/threonine protein kinase
MLGVALNSENYLFVVTELCEEKSLKQFMKKFKGKLPLSVKYKILFEVAVAIYYLHSLSPPLVHRDIKSENIFITSAHRAKLGDFGICKIGLDPMMSPTAIGDASFYQTETIGTIHYMAPESMSRSIFFPASDIYSFGVVAWEFLVETEPFAEFGEFDIMTAVTNPKSVNFFLDHSYSFDPSVKEIINQCLYFKPEERPCAADICDILSKLVKQSSGSLSLM